MANFNTLSSDVLIDVPSVPSFMIISAIRRATIELCEQAQVWEQSDDALVVAKNAHEQDLPLPSGADLIQVISIHRKGVELTPVPLGDMFTMQGAGDTGEPTYYAVDTATSARLYPIPLATESLACRLSLKPKATATAVSNEVTSRWRNALVNGAKHFLLLMPKQEWSDPERAMYYRKLFDKEIAQAKLSRIGGYGRPSLRVRNVSFGA
jgi:hypothetical protein